MNALFKDFTREIKNTRSRFLSIMILVMLAVAFLCGLRSTAPDMKNTLDEYLKEQDFMDIQVMSTLGLTDDDLDELRKLDGVSMVEGSRQLDVYAAGPDTDIIIKLWEIPESINRIVLKEGRMPESVDECLADKVLLSSLGVSIGDRVLLKPDKDNEENLVPRYVTIVGVASSPYYISVERGTSTIGNGSVNAFMYLMPEAFDMDYYISAFLILDGREELTAYSDEYNDFVDSFITAHKDFALERADARVAALKGDADEQLKDADEQLSEAKQQTEKELADAEKELADAQKELADARKELDDGWKEYNKSKADLPAQLADAQKQIEDAERELADNKIILIESKEQLDAALAELEKGEKDYKSGVNSYESGLSQLSSGKRDLESQRAAYNEAKSTLAAIEDGIRQCIDGKAQIREQLDNPLTSALLGPSLRRQLVEIDVQLAELYGYQKQIKDGIAQFEAGEKQVKDAQSQVSSGRSELDAGRKTLDEGWAEYKKGLAEYEDGLAKYNQGVKDLKKAKAELPAQIEDAYKQLADAETKLRDGEKEYAGGYSEYKSGYSEYESGKAEADEKIADAQAQIDDARAQIADIGSCEWYVLGRDSNPGYLGFGQDADRMGNLANVFPLLFYLVAALVCLTTMTRMVEEQRTQIGTLSALGYSYWAISAKYILYGALPSIIGGLLGLLIGYTLFPTMIFTAWQIMYEVPSISLHTYFSTSAFAMLFALISTLAATVSACGNTLRSIPAELMRPKAPVAGKRVFLEYIRPLWTRFGFFQKLTARNLFRYQKRFWMTIIGIGGCAALIICGFGIRSSLISTMDRQYDEIFGYDAIMAFDTAADADQRAAIREYLKKNDDVVGMTEAYMNTVTAQSSEYSISANLLVCSGSEISDYVNLHEFNKEKTPITLGDDGVVIDQKLSELLGAGVGDSFIIDADTRYEVTVAAVNEHYLGHFIYMTPSYYEEVTKSEYKTDAYIARFTSNDLELCNNIFNGFMQLDGTLSASRIMTTRDTYLHSMERIDFVVVIVIISAAALAVVVLYNLSNINITERRRELATIKVLGFYDGEVSAYVYRENIVLTILGILAGLVMGHYLHVWLVRSVEIDMMMFGRDTAPSSYLYASLLTAVFSFAVNILGHFKLKKIDMVESLKSAE